MRLENEREKPFLHQMGVLDGVIASLSVHWAKLFAPPAVESSAGA
jgi:hypothetical protein